MTGSCPIKRLLSAVVLLSRLSYASDIWNEFHPELVTGYGCKIAQFNVTGVVSDAHMYWVVDAWAHRRDYPDWGMSIAYFEPTSKGRTKAMAACDAWMKQVEGKVKAIHDQDGTHPGGSHDSGGRRAHRHKW